WGARSACSSPSRGVAPDGAAGKHGVDQALVEVLRQLPRAQRTRLWAGVADHPPTPLVGVVAGDDHELERGERGGLVVAEPLDADYRVVAEPWAERGTEWLQKAAGGGREAHH